MAKAKKKKGKYDTIIKVNGTFEQVIAASVKNIQVGKNKAKKKK